jgi:signal peptidase
MAQFQSAQRRGMSPKPQKSAAQPKSAASKRASEQQEQDQDDEDSPTLKQYLLSLARDIVIAIIIMIIIIGSLYFYTGNWPPMVVIESNSMMHGSDSSLDVIDTGDLVLVKSIDGDKNNVKPYIQGEKEGYKTYGTYGDVIIFRKNGLDDTPVIHRAIAWVEYNATGHNNIEGGDGVGSFDVPTLNKYDVTKFNIDDFRPGHINLTVDLKQVLMNFMKNDVEPHDGFITKGDNNDIIDQKSLIDANGFVVEPIKPEWVVGKAEGELPWFGLIKLYISGETDQEGKEAPETSRNMLILSIGLIIAIPIILDFTFSYLANKKKQEREEADNKELDGQGKGQMGRVRPGVGGGNAYQQAAYPTRGAGPQQPQTPQKQGTYNGKYGGQFNQSSQNNKNNQNQHFTSKDNLLNKIK